MPWKGLTDWWIDEISSDPAYEQVVTPLLVGLLAPKPGLTFLDVGSGEGRVSREVETYGAKCIGVEASETLARKSSSTMVVGEAGNLPLRDAMLDGVFFVLVIEHIEDHEDVLAEAARVTKEGGILALLMNHPVWTAPGSTPVTDDDGEVLWRPGKYFSFGSSEVPAGKSSVTFHHRTMASLLNAAAETGWALEEMIEQPHHEFVDQAGIPRLLACRWSLLP